MRLVAALALSSYAFAQSLPPAKQIESLLRSSNIRDRAWGAWFAGAAHDPSLFGAVLEQLKLLRSYADSRPNSEEYSAIQTALDTLIQLPGKVSADDILPFAHSRLPETLILWSRNPGEPDIRSRLLELREHPANESEWVAVNDLLYAGGSPFFFQRVLSEIQLKHDFLVGDTPFGGDNGSVPCVLSSRRLAAGFPPAGLYQLIANPNQGDSVFEANPIRMYYRRTVIPTDGHAELTTCGFSPPEFERQFHLAQMLGVAEYLSPKEAESRFQPTTRIHWEGSADKVASEIENLLTDQAAAIRSMVERMRTRKQIPPDLPIPTIKVTIRDIRHDGRVPLQGPFTREIEVEPRKF